MGNGQVLWTCTRRNKTLPPSKSLPVMGEMVSVNTASLDGHLHSSKKRARWAQGFHDELKGHMLDLKRNGPRQVYFARDSPCDENKQPYYTGSVAAWVNKTAPYAVHQDGGIKCAAGASSTIRGRDNIKIGTRNTMTLRAAGKLQ